MALLADGPGVLPGPARGTGLSDRVLVATTSEFGRRPAEHAGGLDHGTASTALLWGPVRPGPHGEAPSLRHLDDDGNLVATVSFDRYQATLATWLGVGPRLGAGRRRLAGPQARSGSLSRSRSANRSDATASRTRVVSSMSGVTKNSSAVMPELPSPCSSARNR